MERGTEEIDITEAAKQAGAEAFSKAMGKGTYDALRDETLCAEIMELWDCDSVGELRGRIGAGEPPPGAAGILTQRARAAYLMAVCAALGIRQTRRNERGR